MIALRDYCEEVLTAHQMYILVPKINSYDDEEKHI